MLRQAPVAAQSADFCPEQVPHYTFNLNLKSTNIRHQKTGSRYRGSRSPTCGCWDIVLTVQGLTELHSESVVFHPTRATCCAPAEAAVSRCCCTSHLLLYFIIFQSHQLTICTAVLHPASKTASVPSPRNRPLQLDGYRHCHPYQNNALNLNPKTSNECSSGSSWLCEQGSVVHAAMSRAML